MSTGTGSVGRLLARAPQLQTAAERVAYHERAPFRLLYNLAGPGTITPVGNALYRLEAPSGTWLLPRARDALRVSVMNDGDRLVDKYCEFVDLGDVDSALDIGSYIGAFARALDRRLVDVAAVEPDPRNRWCVDANAGVPAFPVACTDTDGEARFNVAADHAESSLLPVDAGATAWTIDVTTRRLDTLCHERGLAPDLVKVEGEGVEPEILRGAAGIDAIFTVDVNPERDGQSPRAACREILHERGYETRYDAEHAVLVGWP